MHPSLIGMMVEANAEYNMEADTFTVVVGTVVGANNRCIMVMDETGRVHSCEIPGTLVHDPKEYIRRINKECAKNDGAE